jgi:hypothetical protein
MPACRRHYPGRIDGTDSLALFHRRRPSPHYSWVGSCITCFEACSAFSSRYNLQTQRVAFCDPLHWRLRRLCCLHRRSSCYRVERSSSHAGLSPAVVQRLSRRTVVAWLRQISSSRVKVSLVPSSLCGHLSPCVELMDSVVSDLPGSVRNLWKVIEVLDRIRTRVLLTSNPKD